MSALLPVRRDVRAVAAALPAAERAGDDAEIARLMSRVASPGDMRDLVLLLARCADWGRLNAETGRIAPASPADLHAYFTRLRKRGVAAQDIAWYIRAGEREYQRLSAAERRAGRPGARPWATRTANVTRAARERAGDAA